jgi:hypothetical protein
MLFHQSAQTPGLPPQGKVCDFAVQKWKPPQRRKRQAFVV